MPSLVITDHACLRYLSRIAKNQISIDDARAELEQAFAESKAMKERSGHGHTLRGTESPRPCTLVMKPDEFGAQGDTILVTVLAPREIHETLEDLQDYLSERSEEQRRKEGEREALRYASPGDQIKILTLECQILKEEMALAKVKITALREATQEKYSGKTNALRIAIRGLMGLISQGEALSRIEDIGAYFKTSEFLDVEFER